MNALVTLLIVSKYHLVSLFIIFVVIIVSIFSPYSSNITNDQTFTDDVKLCIRYGVCTVLNRAAKVMIIQLRPTLYTVHCTVYTVHCTLYHNYE